MQLLRFNGFSGDDSNDVDIDDTTAIGITISAYDFDTPGERKINISNSFTIPLTDKNRRILGIPANVQVVNDIMYHTLKCEYWLDNVKLIDGKCKISEIGERITVVIYNKPEIWGYLSDIKWEPTTGTTFNDELTIEQNQLISDGLQLGILKWLQTSGGIYGSEDNKYNGTFNDLIISASTNTENIILPYYHGNLVDYKLAGTIKESEGDLYLGISHVVSGATKESSGGHFCIYVKTIFKFIEEVFNVNFGSGLYMSGNTGDIDNNLFDDVAFNKIVVPLRNIILQGDSTDGFYFKYINGVDTFSPLKETDSYKGKTVYDLFKTIFQTFNCLIDTNDFNNDNYRYEPRENYQIRRFDDLPSYNEPSSLDVDFSGNLTGKNQYSPILSDKYTQNNYITLKEIYTGGLLTSSVSKYIQCDNKNLDLGGTSSVLFTVDSFLNNGIILTGNQQQLIPDLTKSESLKTFSIFYVETENDPIGGYVNIITNDLLVTSPASLYNVSMYDIGGEYNLYASMVKSPIVFTIEKWLTLYDIYNLKMFRRYYIAELGGYYFINKIEGFNPLKSLKPTKLQLIKIQ